ncbi:MAG: rhodanese-like domain-containing protein [Pedosphaera sp.]|nr:rhodanese-like domain-containing protein [Pedosphaera sp.]
MAPAKSSGIVLIPRPVESAALATNPAPVTWAVLKPRLATGQVLLLDARAKGPYEAGHIPGAILLSIFSSTDEFAAFRRTYPTNTPLAVYCGSASCPLSQHLAEQLVNEFGYQHVEHMTTGYLEWQDSEKGKPDVTVPSAAPPPIAADTSGPMPLPVLWDAARVRVEGGELTLVDIRSASEYAAGHLPGAVSLPAESSSAVIAEFQRNQLLSKPILIYGTWTGSSQTFNHGRRLMKEHGFGRVECLHDGFLTCA